MKYSYHPWHKYYLTRAQQEIDLLKSDFPVANIQHFGSTAVPGLGGKGIVDISISVPAQSFTPTFQAICQSAYDYRASGSIPNERMFFQKTIKYDNGRQQLFHLHLTKDGDRNMIDCLQFRDFLRLNPALAYEYSEIKKQAVIAAKEFHNKKDKRQAYMDAKSPVIAKILKLMHNQNTIIL